MSYKGFKFIIILLAIMSLISLSHQISAQSSKAKPKPTPKPTPATASSATLGARETEVLNEIKALRSNPSSFIPYLERMKASFSGNIVTLSGGEKLITNEGVAGINDAIAGLKAAKAIGAFKVSPGLTRAAADHMKDMAQKDFVGHKGSDNSWPPNRVDRYGTWSLEVKENISYRASSAREIVLNMLIDDGNPKREHRKNLLSSNLRYIGLSSGNSKTSGDVCIIVFAGEFAERRGGK